MAFKKYLILSIAVISLGGFTLAQTEELPADASADAAIVEEVSTEAPADEAVATEEEAGLDDSLFDDDLFDDDALFDDTEVTTETENNATTIGWGYTPDVLITTKEQGADYVTLTSPLVVDGNGAIITNYKVVYSTSPVDSTEASQLRDMVFNFDDLTLESTSVDFKLEGLTEGATYYALVIPFNKDGVEGDSSEEVSIQVGAHNASVAQIKDLSYTVDKGVVSLTWNPEVGAPKVEVFSRSEQENDFTSIGTVDSAAGTYNLTIAQAGNYFVKLIPVNAEGAVAGDEIIQSVKVEEVVAVETPAPRVGPASNALIALIAMVMMGYVYTRARRYSK